MSDRAGDLSAYLQPSKRRVFAWLRWRFTQQPHHIAKKMRESLTGEREPIRRYGGKLWA